jgi:hypothetical protein
VKVSGKRSQGNPLKAIGAGIKSEMHVIALQRIFNEPDRFAGLPRESLWGLVKRMIKYSSLSIYMETGKQISCQFNQWG